MPTEEPVITVEARVVGQRKPLISGWQVPLYTLPSEGAGGSLLLLRDLISHIVRQEVRAYLQRQDERKLIRVLSPEQIRESAAWGKVEMGGVHEGLAGRAAGEELTEEAAIATALQAFEDGLYFVFLDDQQQQDLAAPVMVRPAGKVTFIRLVALAGG